jgi:DNA-binding NarL/FixJ family response regulator
MLVEDDALVRRSVADQLASSDTFELAVEAPSVAAAHQALDASRPDVVLLDLGLPDGSGLELLGQARARVPAPPCIVLTIFDDDAHIFEALRAGAVGYLLKRDLTTRLLLGLSEAIAGGSPMSPGIARRVLSSFAVQPEPVTSLTPRELEVTQLLSKGSTYDEIAHMLGVSSNTVRSFIRSIYEKLQVNSRTEAVWEALRQGLIRLP